MTSLATATEKIARAEDIRNDTKLIMKPYANWEEYLVPAPTSLAILGELILISSKIDFSINKNPPKDGFRYLRYPDSFRACLLQVTNSGWAAFNEAHKNMDQIRLLSANVGPCVREVVKILVQDDDQLVQLILPNHLQEIEDIANECTELSKTTESKFEFVILLIQELMEACVNSKGSYEDELHLMRMKITKYTERQKAAEECKRMTEESLKRMTAELENASGSYNRAVDSMPSGWEILGMNFIGSITDAIASVFQSVTMQIARGPDAVTATRSQQNSEDPSISIAVFSKSGQVLNLVNQMQSCIDSGTTIDFNKLYADEKKERALPVYWQQEYEHIKSTVIQLEGKKGKPSKTCIDICDKAIGTCQRLTTALKGEKTTVGIEERLAQDLKDLQTLAKKFDTKSKAYSGAPSFPVTPPQLANNQQPSGLPGQVASDNARFKVEQTRAQLNYAREQVDKNTESLQNNTRELAKVLAKLQNCRVQEINFNDTIELLIRGLEAMGKMREQWEKMVRFFQMISSIINTSLRTSLNKFVTSANEMQISQLTYSAKYFMKDMIYQQALFASNIASLVNMISGTYFEISDRFLMDRVSSLGRLISVAPSDPGFAAERAKLHSGCMQAQDGIRRLAVENQRDFERKLGERVANIENELLAALPPASQDDLQRNSNIVQSVMRDLTAEENNQFV